MLHFTGSFQLGGWSVPIILLLFDIQNLNTVACRVHFAYRLKVKPQIQLWSVAYIQLNFTLDALVKITGAFFIEKSCTRLRRVVESYMLCTFIPGLVFCKNCICRVLGVWFDDLLRRMQRLVRIPHPPQPQSLCVLIINDIGILSHK